MPEEAKTCGVCKNGQFPLTPTGRIKKKATGRCLSVRSLTNILFLTPPIPCLRLLRNGIYTVVIKPEYEAESCPLFSRRTPAPAIAPAPKRAAKVVPAERGKASRGAANPKQ